MSCREVGFLPNGDLVSFSEDRTVCLWNAKSGERISVFTGEEAEMFRLAVSPDGRTVATTSDTENGLVTLWNVPARQRMYRLPSVGGPIRRLDFSPDGRILAVVRSSGEVALFDTRADGPPIMLASFPFCFDARPRSFTNSHVSDAMIESLTKSEF